MDKLHSDSTIVLRPYRHNQQHVHRHMSSTRKTAQFLLIIIITVSFFYLVIYMQLQDVQVEGWEYHTSRDIGQYILPNNATTLIRPPNFCESPLFLLVIVCSSPTNIEARNAVRDTWALEQNVSNSAVKVYFLLGETWNSTLQQKIQEESDLYNDIIQEHFIDTYNNLTIKSVMLLKLVKSFCVNSVRFVMKTDDDMFVFMENLVNMLIKKKLSRRLLLGNVICGARPIKVVNNKWYTSEYMYSKKVYPNYISGTGYVMSIDTVLLLLDAALRTPIFHLEDVYVTGICAKTAKIEPRHHAAFTYTKREFDPCMFKDLVTVHYFEPPDIFQTYLRIKNSSLEDACRLQVESRNYTTSNHNHSRRVVKRTIGNYVHQRFD